jgi:hypothetical protein
MTKIVKCRAKGGVTSCTDPNCPERLALKRETLENLRNRLKTPATPGADKTRVIKSAEAYGLFGTKAT